MKPLLMEKTRINLDILLPEVSEKEVWRLRNITVICWLKQ